MNRKRKSTLARLCAALKSRTAAYSCAAKRSEIRNEKSEVCRKIQNGFSGSGQLFRPAPDAGEGSKVSEMPSSPEKKQKKRVRQLLEQCGLRKEFAKRHPHEHGGGQCQRAIARALAIEPQILICDEATSALDVAVRNRSWSFWICCERKNISTIYLSVTIWHWYSLLRSDSRHEAGKMVEEGTPEEVIYIRNIRIPNYW